MWQFIYGSDEMFEDLRHRARRACVRFPDQEMPPGSAPARAAIGFEIDAHTGRVRLLVERGVVYQGSINEVERWLAEGSRTFEDIAQLRSWLGSKLRQAYGVRPSELASEPGSNHAYTLYEAEHDLDDVGVEALRLAMRLGCPMKDLPS
jgi:hypothetical protein